jgi:hypothetical protein
MEEANKRFLKYTMGLELEKRSVSSYEYSDKDIKNGDVLAIMRLDGIDPIIMYGTGTHIGHCTMALWFGDELYVIEAQQSWFWPKPHV